MQQFASFDSFIQGNSTNCHTQDRNNLRAHLECGIGDSAALQTYAEVKMLKENWSFAQSSKVLNCLQNYMPNSYGNILKSGAVENKIINIMGVIAVSMVMIFISN